MYPEDSGAIDAMRVLKSVPEIEKIYCATSNQVEILISERDNKRNVMGLVGGYSPKTETEVQMIKKPRNLLNLFGYKN